MGCLIYFLISFFLAIIVRIDARLRKNKAPLTWGLIVFIFSILGVIAYIISIRKQVKYHTFQLCLEDLIEKLKFNDFIIEHRKNLSVEGYVILYEGEEYKIVENANRNSTHLSLVIPTRIRLIYGLIITFLASLIISLITERSLVFGLIFLLLSTYIVDYFYKNNKIKITEKLTCSITKIIEK